MVEFFIKEVEDTNDRNKEIEDRFIAWCENEGMLHKTKLGSNSNGIRGVFTSCNISRNSSSAKLRDE